jgi:hypothetical protein
MEIKVDQRRFLRLKSKSKLFSDIAVVKVKNQPVKTGKKQIIVTDICLGGLQFISNLKFPVSSNMMLSFKLQIIDDIILLYGYVIRMQELKNGIYEYGIKFNNDRAMHSLLIGLFNKGIEMDFFFSNRTHLKNYTPPYIPKRGNII